MAELESTDPLASIERTADEDGARAFRVSGELDISSVDAVEAALEGELDSPAARVIFDLGELTFMDSSGIALFLRIAGRVKALELRHVRPTIRRVIEVSGLTDLFHIVS